MPPLLRQEGSPVIARRKLNEPVIVGISREMVEAGDWLETAEVLRTFAKTPERTASFREEIELVFNGYDDDPLPLWEIPEVREFVARLDEEFPFFLMKWGYGLQLV